MTTRDVKRTASFFNRLGEGYIDEAESSYHAIYQFTSSVIRPYLRGRILDVGSGGVDISSNGQADIWFSYDVSLTLLKQHTRSENRETICGESIHLPFAEESFDVVLAHFSFHHFAQESVNATYQYIRKCLLEMGRVCRPDGRVIVAENTISPIMERFQTGVYAMMRGILHIIKRPSVQLFSAETLRSFFIASGFEPQILGSFRSATKALIVPVYIPRRLNPITVTVFCGKPL